MMNNQSNVGDYGLNIREISKMNKEMVDLYERLNEKKLNIDDGKFLLSRISDFIMECSYILNTQIVPTDPARRIKPRTAKMLKNYIANWSNVSAEIKRNMPRFSWISLFGISRETYYETAQDDNIISSKSDELLRNKEKEVPNIMIKRISRDYY